MLHIDINEYTSIEQLKSAFYDAETMEICCKNGCKLVSSKSMAEKLMMNQNSTPKELQERIFYYKKSIFEGKEYVMLFEVILD